MRDAIHERSPSIPGEPMRQRRAVTTSRRLTRLGLIMALLLLLAGCATRAPVSNAGQWLGAFTCGDGLVGLTLDIGEAIGEHVPATFSFYALPSNPGVPNGSFWMGGRRSGNEQLILSAGGWLQQPPGWDLLDLDGTFSADRRTYSGVVVGSPDCTGFFVSKAD